MNMCAIFKKIPWILAYNYIALFIAATQVLMINLLLLKFSDLSALAYFNYCYLLVIIGGQLACFGIHYSILHDVSNGYKNVFASVISGLFLIALLCIFIVPILAIFIFTTRPDPINIQLFQAFFMCSITIFVLALNKVLLSYFNGKNRMVIFSTAYLVRALITFLSVGLWFIYPMHISVFVCIAIAEIITFIILFTLFLKSETKNSKVKDIKICAKNHIHFGKYTAIGAIAMESNIRIDCLFISFMMSPTVFAQYSFLSMVFEGLHYFYTIIRNFVNISVVSHFDSAKYKEITVYKRLALSGGILFFILGGLLYYPIVNYLDMGLEDYYGAFMILMAALLLASYFLPFDQLANQKGNPRYYFQMAIVTIAVNIILNMCFISVWGFYGAALATAIAYGVLSFMIFKSMKKYKVI